MPGQKKKYNVRFPPGRIKKIMQKDTEVGRIATAVPVIISRALEMFLKSLLTKTCQITQSKHSRVMSLTHMKQCIETEKLFDFLRDLVEQAMMPPAERDGRARGKRTSHRKRWQEVSIKTKRQDPVERSRRANSDSTDHLDDSESELFICLGAEIEQSH